MTPLSGKQKSHLRSLGHHLKPLLQVGKGGITDSFIDQLKIILETHELIKIKVIKNSDLDLSEAEEQITSKLPCQIAQKIGKTLLIYLPNQEEPKIKIPK
ncbi:MAG: ribosome assembly RNA-binding protein YhbY [SAR324 cluster bacterium]|nr:ribosome assembly RNA-binding protein YhbY [SAR324 cluster bacterium]